jgi:methionyl-tRNA synthetase
MTKNIYITSPIYYVNDAPHIGHAYTSIACDTLARFYRLNNCQVYFLTGTDEHGQKVEKSAFLKNIPPQEFCDEVSQKFRQLTEFLNLSNNDFIRTTETRHTDNVVKFWQILYEKGYIYQGVYEGWYAVRDEAFYSADEIIDGKAPSGAEVTWHKEESYFFKLSAFQEKLLAFYETNPHFIQPISRYNEVVSFVKNGLKDLSISRNSFTWGVKVPNDTSNIIYVWLDALTNYLSALDFANNSLKYQQFWQEAIPLHIVGKDIIRFHAVYWPAFLMAANINLPHIIYAHGWWTNSGQKISKSLGNVICPYQEVAYLQNKLPPPALNFINQNSTLSIAVDYFRYFLLKEVPFGNDGDYSRNNLIKRINAELVNNIGNLVQRCLTMVSKEFSFGLPIASHSAISLCETYSQQFFTAMQKFSYDKALSAIIDFASLINKQFNDTAPWNLKKQNKISEMQQCLLQTTDAIRIIGIMLLPFIPTSAHKILDILNIASDQRNFLNLTTSWQDNHQISTFYPVFPRLQ